MRVSLPSESSFAPASSTFIQLKTTIPDALKADEPHAKWAKTLNATPVVMTVVATLLAGLSSSEMTSAQYDRSLAAQLQSKAGDQWNYFQGKKLRSSIQYSTLDVIASGADSHVFDQSELRQALTGTPAADIPNSPAGIEALTRLQEGSLPQSAPVAPVEPLVPLDPVAPVAPVAPIWASRVQKVALVSG